MKQTVSFSKSLQEDMRLIAVHRGMAPSLFRDGIISVVESMIEERMKNVLHSVRMAYVLGTMSDKQYEKLLKRKVSSSLLKRRKEHEDDSVKYLKNTREGLLRNFEKESV